MLPCAVAELSTSRGVAAHTQQELAPQPSHHCRDQLLRAAAADTVMQQRCEEQTRQATIEHLHDKTATLRTLAAEVAAAGMSPDVRRQMAEAHAALQEVVAAR